MNVARLVTSPSVFFFTIFFAKPPSIPPTPPDALGFASSSLCFCACAISSADFTASIVVVV